MTFELSGAAQLDLMGLHLSQTLFFVMSSRAKDALVRRAYVSKVTASRDARNVGGCVRVGYVDNGKAVTL